MTVDIRGWCLPGVMVSPTEEGWVADEVDEHGQGRCRVRVGAADARGLWEALGMWRTSSASDVAEPCARANGDNWQPLVVWTGPWDWRGSEGTYPPPELMNWAEAND